MNKIFLILAVFLFSGFAQAKNCTVAEINQTEEKNLGTFDAPMTNSFDSDTKVGTFIIAPNKDKEQGLLVKCTNQLVSGYGNLPLVACAFYNFDSISEDKAVNRKLIAYSQGLGTVMLISVNPKLQKKYKVFCF